MGYPELVQAVELRNPNIVAGQVDIDSGSPADDVLNIPLVEPPWGMHAEIVKDGAFLVSRLLTLREVDSPGGKVHRESNNARNDEKEKPHSIENNDERVQIATLFLIDAVGVDDRSAGGE